MGAMKSEDATGCLELTAQQVADAFVQQYYHIFYSSPENVHRFYKDHSIMARPGSDGMMLAVSTLLGINDAVMSSTYKGCDPIVEAVHGQDSIMESVIVGVTGTLTDKNIKRKFAQTFFLAPQETGGFYVHNDLLYFLDVAEPTASLSGPPEIPEAVDVPKSPEVPEAVTVPKSPEVPEAVAVPKSPEVPEAVAVPKSPAASSPDSSEVADVPNDEIQTISASDPTPKEAFEISKKLRTPASPKKQSALPLKESVGSVQEDICKKVSYASVLAREAHLSTTAQVSTPPGATLSKAGPLAPSKAASTPLSVAPGINDGLAAEAPTGIHIKDLPPDMTQVALLEEVKKFGAVRPNSVHIREYPEDGYRFAFVEYESSKSARKAVEAGEIWIGGWKFEVQYKRSPNQGGSNQGRPMAGRSGSVYKNDNRGGRDWEGRGGRDWEGRGGRDWEGRGGRDWEGRGGKDGEPRGPNWRSSTQDQVRGGGSSTATKRNGGSTIRV